jgi:cytochrome c-type biogenesis protein CcmE
MTTNDSDSELANAREGSDDEAGVVVPRRRRSAQARQSQGKVGLVVVIGLVSAAAALVALVLTGLQDKGMYSKQVDDLVKEKDRYVGKGVRVEGVLVHGSLVVRNSPCEYRFRIEKNGSEIPVRFAQCIVPDTFRDVKDIDVGVTVAGKLQADGNFEATEVIAKCPSKYDEMKERAAKGEKAPHAVPGSPSM